MDISHAWVVKNEVRQYPHEPHREAGSGGHPDGTEEWDLSPHHWATDNHIGRAQPSPNRTGPRADTSPERSVQEWKSPINRPRRNREDI